MVQRGRQLAACLAMLLTVLLAGCDVSGRIEVRSPEEAVVDLTITQDADDAACAFGGLDAGDQLTVTPGTTAGGLQTCRVQGTVHPESFRPYLNVTHVGEYVTASFNPLSRAPGTTGGDDETSIGVGGLDVTIQFPGDVLTTTGEADGSAAHFRDVRQLTRPYGLHAEALDHPGPAWATIGPAAGFVAGAAAGALGLFLAYRRRAQPGDEPETGLGQPAGADGDDDGPPEGDADEGLGDVDGPPAASSGGGPEPPRRRPDDSVWAPPAER